MIGDEITIDSRSGDERDDTPVLITRGMLRQLLRMAFLRHTGDRLQNVRFPLIDEGSIIVSAMLHPDDDAISVGLADGRELQCEIWPDEIGG